MASKIILADTSVLIEHFRKSDKSKTLLLSLFDQGFEFCISTVTEYEIHSGAPTQQIDYWRKFLLNTTILPFDSAAVNEAVKIYNLLKVRNKQIDKADLFIAATAISNNLPIATLNRKHFERIDGLTLIE